uniref:Uncharacterized protein n=1 Tax=Picea sitchensis TaxID=3332 RepID=A0A6B9XXH5_PICSI|nr:hypothetical protein Q903MT_gene6771 [Picea sitchensis]
MLTICSCVRWDWGSVPGRSTMGVFWTSRLSSQEQIIHVINRASRGASHRSFSFTTRRGVTHCLSHSRIHCSLTRGRSKLSLGSDKSLFILIHME